MHVKPFGLVISGPDSTGTRFIVSLCKTGLLSGLLVEDQEVVALSLKTQNILFFFFLIQFNVPFKIISDHMRRASL